jgi:hypothetical protein
MACGPGRPALGGRWVRLRGGRARPHRGPGMRLADRRGVGQGSDLQEQWWARQGLNLRLLPCQIQRANPVMYVGRLEAGKDHRKAAGGRRCHRPAAPTIRHASAGVVLIPTAVGCCPSAARLTEADLGDHNLPRSPQCPAARRVAVGSIPDSLPNISSIACLGGDLARPGPEPADRGAAAAVRAAARRRLGHHPGGGCQRRTLHLC